MYPIIDLRNTFFVLRHGHSEANARGLIISAAETGIDQYGLTAEGRRQVRHSIHTSGLTRIAAVYASDFRRTRETAEIAAELLGAPVNLSAQLRERYFGQWEATSNANYETVWRQDQLDPTHQDGEVESVASVARRMVQLLETIDGQHQDESLLLVSHGDPLQILLTAVAGGQLNQHRSQPPLETAEIRRLTPAEHSDQNNRHR